MYMSVTDLSGKMRGYCEEVFENALDDRLIDHNPVPPARNFTSPNKKTKHHGTIEAARLPDLHNYIIDCNYTAAFKACAIALIISGLRVSNIALLRQENYDPQTGKFTIPAKTGDKDTDGLMKSGREYTGVFPDGVRQMINDQLVEGHEHVFVSSYNGRCINPESLRKLFKGFDKNMTSHGFRNTFKEWGHNNDVPAFLIDRYTDHALQGLDAAYRRFDTLEARCAQKSGVVTMPMRSLE
jgi:integrase